MALKELIKKTELFKFVKSYGIARKMIDNPVHQEVEIKTKLEISKTPERSLVINFLLSQFDRNNKYLEIGVFKPENNFLKIKSQEKYSVDPGVEYKVNPVDFKMTSDEFFSELDLGKILSKDIKFDVIFIDGLHLAEQVDRDIINSLKYLADDGFLVLHDCNPPSEWHAREEYGYHESPSQAYWNGTTWKAFLKWRFDESVTSCCVDTDWGVGVISKKHLFGKQIAPQNLFFEFKELEANRKQMLNLISFDDFKNIISRAKHSL